MFLWARASMPASCLTEELNAQQVQLATVGQSAEQPTWSLWVVESAAKRAWSLILSLVYAFVSSRVASSPSGPPGFAWHFMGRA